MGAGTWWWSPKRTVVAGVWIDGDGGCRQVTLDTDDSTEWAAPPGGPPNCRYEVGAQAEEGAEVDEPEMVEEEDYSFPAYSHSTGSYLIVNLAQWDWVAAAAVLMAVLNVIFIVGMCALSKRKKALYTVVAVDSEAEDLK